MVFLYFLLMTSALADPKFTKLEEGDPAPWSGRLFNDEAVTQFIISDKFKVEQCNIQIEYELQKTTANLFLEHQKAIIELESKNKLLADKIALRDSRITGLESIKTPHNPFWYTVGGILIGSSITIGIAQAVNVN
jgi:hypothetical protein